jgi:NhaA family Na+:H+ antiporter
MKLTHLFEDFISSEKSGGIVLVCCTILSLFLANSAIQTGYLHIWHTGLAGHSVEYWINDALMAIFFLLIGLELEREIYIGELSDFKGASLPIIGALGGMLVPAAIYLAFNFGTDTRSGAGIPMATDIAFAVGILSLLGKRVPSSMKIFLTALAVIDDLGAILIIAIFYTGALDFINLAVSLTIFAGLIVMNRMKVMNLIPYLIGGVAMWYFMLHSGIHATITGVLVAFTIPFRNGDERAPSAQLLHYLHKPVAFVILPLFALANTGIILNGNWQESLIHASSLGIMAGLIIGKPLGIFLFTWIGTGLGLCALPSDLNWKQIIGTGFLAGIGFTMSIFITMLAFDQQELINHSKLAVLTASLIAGITGYVWLNYSLKKVRKAR